MICCWLPGGVGAPVILSGLVMPAYVPAYVPAHVVGLMAYGTTMVACLYAAVHVSRDGHQDRHLRRLAGTLAVLEALLFLDIFFNWRWAIHTWLQDRFELHNLYDQRRGIQSVVLIVLAVVLLLALRSVFRNLRGRIWAAAAVCGACLSLSLWCVEIISLHQIDQLLYATVGPTLVIAYLWLLLSLLTTASVLIAARV